MPLSTGHLKTIGMADLQISVEFISHPLEHVSQQGLWYAQLPFAHLSDKCDVIDVIHLCDVLWNVQMAYNLDYIISLAQN